MGRDSAVGDYGPHQLYFAQSKHKRITGRTLPHHIVHQTFSVFGYVGPPLLASLQIRAADRAPDRTTPSREPLLAGAAAQLLAKMVHAAKDQRNPRADRDSPGSVSGQGLTLSKDAQGGISFDQIVSQYPSGIY